MQAMWHVTLVNSCEDKLDVKPRAMRFMTVISDEEAAVPSGADLEHLSTGEACRVVVPAGEQDRTMRGGVVAVGRASP